MQKVMRWGVVGASKFARTQMVPAMMLAQNTQFCALATSNPEKAAPFQAMEPNLKIYTDYDALLADPEIDALYLPLPNHLHVQWCKKGLDAGKHVLCEKPIAMRAEEIDDLIAMRDSSGLLLAEAYMIVHHPQWHYARELYQSGAIGELVQVDGVFSYNNSADPNNIRNRPETGGGSLPDIGVYTMGAARFVTDEEPVEIVDANITWQNDVDVWAAINAKFPSFHFNATTSMRMAPRQEMNFHGTKGLIRLTAPFNPSVFSQAEVELHSADMVVSTKRYPAENHYVNQLQAFRASALEGTPYGCTLEFSQGTQRMIDMALKKARGD
ncbi:gfo/Idh/MocA family oxidoreductase [Rhodobacteraceae bacterium Araon29]